MSDSNNTDSNESDLKITATAGNLAFGGDFVCQVSTCEQPQLIGIKAFTPYVIPGETFTAIVSENAGKFLKAELEEIIHASPERVTPDCPHFQVCGGCSLQHISYPEQVKIKQQMIASALRYDAGLKSDSDQQQEIITKTSPAYNYRQRIKLQVNHYGRLGFFKRGSNEVVSINSCSIASKLVNKALQRVKNLNSKLLAKFCNITIEEFSEQIFLEFSWRGNTKPQRIGLVQLSDLLLDFAELNRVNVAWNNDVLYTFGSTEHGEQKYPTGHFSQVNTFGNRELQAIVLNEASGYTSALELYAGAGNFSIPLAQAGLTTTAVEMDSALVEFGQSRSQQINEKINWHNCSCEKYFRQHQPEALVIADPPRSGLKAIMPALAAPIVECLIYISCSLPHLTRDLKQLTEYGYRLERLYFVDMFPQTHYVETIAVLKRI